MEEVESQLIFCGLCDKIRMNKTQIIFLFIILIPTVILVISTFFSLLIFQDMCQQMIDKFAEDLYIDQINSSQSQNTAVVIQLNQQVQKISWQVNILSEFFGLVIQGDVIKNRNHIPAIHNIDRSYFNDEDPVVLAMFRRSPVLTSVWHHVNKTRISEFDDREIAQLDNGVRMDSIWKAIKYENIHAQGVHLKIKDIFNGYEYDGSFYMTSINSTFSAYPIPKGCPYVGKYRLDLRCRYFYLPTIQSYSIVLYDPQTLYTEGNPYLASAFCQRRLKYETTNPDSTSEIYSILCITLDLSIISQYFKNFGSNSKFQVFLDPRKLSVIYHSQIQLQRATIETVQDLETKYLQDQDEAKKFIDNINQFNQYILESTNNIDIMGVSKQMTQKTFEYKRNNTECYVIINLITMIDKVPKYEYLKSINPSKRFQIKGAFLFLDVLSKDQMNQYSIDLKQQIKIFNNYFNYTSWTLFALVLGFQVYFSFHLGKNLMHPVIHLTNVLKSIHFQNGKHPNQPRPQPHYAKENLYTDPHFQNQQKTQAMTFFSEVFTEIENVILIDEQLDADSEDVCFSSDTQVLLDSFQNLFKILRFTTHNFYKENESVSLLNLNIEIQHFEQFKNYRALGVCHNNMGIIHYNCERYVEAFESFQKALIYAKYELNFYSPDCQEGIDLINNIKKNNIELKNRLFLNSDSQDSINLGMSLETLNERNKNKSCFANKTVGNQTYQNGQYNTDKEHLYWNLYNRNQNLIKALASYLEKQDKQNNNLWDILTDIAIENISICQLYLPQSNKRSMLNYYIILLGYFNQNLTYESNNLLMKFSNLYIQSFQKKNHSTNDNVAAMAQSQNKASLNMNETKILQSQIGSNFMAEQLSHSQLLFSPLHILKPKRSKRIQFQNQTYNKSNFNLDKSDFNINKQNFETNNLINIAHQNMAFQEKIKQINYSLHNQDNQLQDNSIDQISRDSSFSQIISKADIQNSSPFQFGRKVCTFSESQNSFSKRQQSLNAQHNIVSSLNNQKQIMDIKRSNSNDFNRKTVELLFDDDDNNNQILQNYQPNNLNQSKNQLNDYTNKRNDQQKFQSGQIKMTQLGEGSKQNNKSSDSQMKISKAQISTTKYDNFLTRIASKQNESSKIKLNSQKNKPNYNSKEKNLKRQRFQSEVEENQSSQDKQCKIVKQTDNQIDMIRDLLESQETVLNRKKSIESQRQFKGIHQRQYKTETQKINKTIYYSVRKMVKSDKISKYEYSSDIFFSYYALQQAQFQIKSQNYLNAALLITNLLEQCEQYFPHLKKKALEKLSIIFEKQNVYSPELEEMKNKYIKLVDCSYSACIISSCQSANKQKKVYTICSDLINEVLFKESDSFGLIQYSFDERIYLLQMGLTTIHTIKTAPQFFEQIIKSSCSQKLSLNLQQLYNKRIQINESPSIFNNESLVMQYQNDQNTQNLQDSTHQLKSQQNYSIIQYTKEETKLNCQSKPHEIETCNGLLHNEQLNLTNNNKNVSLTSFTSFETDIISNFEKYNLQNKANNFKQNQIISYQQQNKTISYLKNLNNPPQQIFTPSNFSKFKEEKIKEFIFSDWKIKQQQSPQSIIPTYLFSTLVQKMNNSTKNQIQNNNNNNNSNNSNNNNNKNNTYFISEIGCNYQKQKEDFGDNKNPNQVILMDENCILENIQNDICVNKQIPQLPILSTQNSQEQIISQHTELSPSYGLDNYVSSPLSKKDCKDIEQNKFKNDSNNMNAEQVFHQGIQASLKHFILNSDEKITCYISLNNFQRYCNKRIKINKSRKTYLIYITDQNLKFENKFMLNQLSQALWNLDLELLVLILNPKQTIEEYTELQDIFLKQKSVINFFSSEEKMLQYMYNQREHVKNNLIPMIVEHF